MNTTRAGELTELIKKINSELAEESKLLKIVDEALTHKSTGRSPNLDKLEFLGDAVLRLAATEYINYNYKNLAVGESSKLRAQLVSDRWLAEVGAGLAIETYLLLGKQAQRDPTARLRLQADATEALIGALYIALGNLEAIHQWLTPHWHTTANAVMATPEQFNSKTALQEWSQSQELGLPNYATKECSRQHGDPGRFRCRVWIKDQKLAEAKGRSRKEAEQNAAAAALEKLNRLK